MTHHRAFSWQRSLCLLTSNRRKYEHRRTWRLGRGEGGGEATVIVGQTKASRAIYYSLHSRVNGCRTLGSFKRCIIKINRRNSLNIGGNNFKKKKYMQSPSPPPLISFPPVRLWVRETYSGDLGFQVDYSRDWIALHSFNKASKSPASHKFNTFTILLRFRLEWWLLKK